MPAEQRFTRRLLGDKPTISLGASISQETPYEPVQTKSSLRQFYWKNLLLERERSCVLLRTKLVSLTGIWGAVQYPRDFCEQTEKPDAHVENSVFYTNYTRFFPSWESQCQRLIHIFYLNLPHTSREKKWCLLSGCLLTDWSSFIGSCTLPLHWGTQGGSNIGTDGIPSTGEGRVKFILGGGI